ncbi:3-oxoacyl-[acyl-carrier-protein] reductase FabG [Vanrija pseudolonga]|uniref:3-oxoacyl-[acyl-carrier-protein] reductase FabG n=1 Tax=Vanrija pseudolonga TaxID=143232 RepID=A0AAF1BI76_9TREE|nr:3-oxoacyl-[acyl-carrier-protein] reductase FabG [Vanrija pseudolonga]
MPLPPSIKNAEAAGAMAGAVVGTGALKIDNLYNVDGWVAVVTGGGTGLGLITAAALAENGARVYITGRRLEALQAAVADASPKSGNGKIIALQGNASTKEGIEATVAEISKHDKYINVLVNNHGIAVPEGSPPNINGVPQTFEGLSKAMMGDSMEDHWIPLWRINTASYYFTSAAFLPLLGAAAQHFAEPGNIVNIASMSGITKTSQKGQFNYNASKAATISLSHQLATEFARRDLGVRVNCICPGFFPSGMVPITPGDLAAGEAANRFRKDWGIPLKRPSNGVDYANCIISVMTNKYMTGSEVVIDGGWLLCMEN